MFCIKSNTVQNNIKQDIFDKRKIYIGYTGRLFISFIGILICLLLSTSILVKSFDFIDETYLNYQEKSNLDYQVYLKRNEFYEQYYLEKDMIYVASLINNIKVKFNYLFNSNNNLDLNFDYDVIGKLSIVDATSKNTFFTKEYKLVSKKNSN